MSKMLDDVVVIEIAQGIGGPFAGKLLSNWGARVTKVEPREGDVSRRMGPFPDDVPDSEASGWFLYLNTAKQSITLDMRAATARDILKRLISEADVLIEDLDARTAEELGLGYSHLADVNPRLIVTSITPFGKTGPYAAYKANDFILQAMGGFMSVNGDPKRSPLQIPLEHGLHMVGRQAAMATMFALHHQRETGEGQHVDISSMECVLMEPSFMMLWYTYLGGIEGRGRGYGARVVDGDLKACKDGWIALTADGGNSWESFADFFGVSELKDQKFASRAGRRERSGELEALMAPVLNQRDKMELFQTAMRERFVFGPVQTVEEIMHCPQLAARDFFQEISHPKTGKMKYPGPGMRFTQQSPTSVPAPFLGQHNSDVYVGRLNYSSEDLVRMRNMGVI